VRICTKVISCDKRYLILNSLSFYFESFLGGDGDGGEIEDGTATTSSSGATTTIFRTLAMQESFEEQAVANLRREIDTLRKGVIPSHFLL